MKKVKLLCALLICFLPSFLKILIYRHVFGYKIGSGCRIGCSLIMVRSLEMADNVRIGHFNIIVEVVAMSMGEHSMIGHFNIIRGGDEVRIGAKAQIFRFNEINSIVNPIITNVADPRLIIGEGTVITAMHKIDFTDNITFGRNVVFAGRNSCLWTHNRQQTKPITIGDNCYVGSGVQMVPGSALPAFCVIGVASVITKKLVGDYNLIAGIPAKVVKPLDKEGRVLVTYSTRPDLEPDASRLKPVDR